MVGRYSIKVKSKRIVYDFSIERKYNVIRGRSSSGKTTLYELVSKKGSGDISVQCLDEHGNRCRISSLPQAREDYEPILEQSKNTIFIVDEDAEGISSKHFAALLKHSDNYFIIMSRQDLECIPISINAIFEIDYERKYNNMGDVYIYNTFKNSFVENDFNQFDVDVFITEDLGSGFNYFSNVLQCDCVGAGGRSNIINTVDSELHNNNVFDKGICIIADGSCFGSQIENVLSFMRHCDVPIKLLLPESLEYLFLKSGVFPCKMGVMTKIYDYCDKKSFAELTNNYKVPSRVSFDTWEQFCFYYLSYITGDMGKYSGSYSKSKDFIFTEIYYRAWGYIKKYLAVLK